MEPLNILVAVRYQILRDGIKKILAEESGISVKGTAKNEDELFALPLENESILVLEIGISDLEDSDIIIDLVEHYPKIRILVLSEKKNPEHIKRIMQAGASGYIFKRQSSNDLIEALKRVGAGDEYLCDEVIRLLLQQGDIAEEFRPENYLATDLTDRELEVLGLICQELTNRDIAEKLQISIRTVDAHRRNVLQKTGAKNTAGLVKYAIKHRIYNL